MSCTEIYHTKGPLSQYANALLFSIFGLGLKTLVYANIIISLGIIALMYSILRYITSVFPATIACLSFVIMFCFSQYVQVANYNYITPYTHEVTHGMLLIFAMLGCMTCALIKRNILFVMLAGLCIGLASLTKPEICLSSLCGYVSFIIVIALLKYEIKKALLWALFLISSTLIPVIAAYLMLKSIMPEDIAIKGTFGIFSGIHLGVNELRFYKMIMGTNDKAQNFKIMFYSFVVFSSGISLSVLIGFYDRVHKAISLLIFALLLVFSFDKWENILYFLKYTASPFQLIVALACIWSGWNTWRKRSPRWGVSFVFSCISLAMLAKMAFRPGIFHYGFILSMPAMMVVILLAFSWVPECLEKYNFNSKAYSCTLAILLYIIVAWHYALTSAIYKHASIEIGEGVDLFISNASGFNVTKAISWLKNNTTSTETLLVLPGGVMIN